MQVLLGQVQCTSLFELSTARHNTNITSYSTGTSQVDAKFGVGQEVGTLGTALLLFGFGMTAIFLNILASIRLINESRAWSSGLGSTFRSIRPQASRSSTLLHCCNLLIWHGDSKRPADGDDHSILHGILRFRAGDQYRGCTG